MDDAQVIERCADMVMEASALLVTAGAGMGIDSGLPDFRGNEGMWRAYPALGEAKMDFTKIASPTAFERQPKLAWGFYGHRLKLYRETVPHDGFHILKAIGARLEDGVFVLTSNVDGQFQKAGFDADAVCEIHGSIHYLQCMRPCPDSPWPTGWPADEVQPVVDEARCEMLSPLPTCRFCGSLVRPNILMFNDGGWVSERTDAQWARFARWQRQAKQPVIIELGAGTTIPSIRNLGDSAGHPLIRINTREPEVWRPGHVGVASGALAAMTAIGDELVRRGFLAAV